jgi:thioredoxin reductase
MTEDMLDVLVVGGGPAGLSAALVLGRCRRRVLLCDSGEPRNQASAHVSGYLSRDGCRPADLRAVGRRQLEPYDSVTVRDMAVEDVVREDSDFRATLADGSTVRAKRILLATGLKDTFPALDGAERLFGKGVWTCPYCDGWELRDQPLAVYGAGPEIVGFALELRLWSADIALLTDGPSGIGPGDLDLLERAGVRVIEEAVETLEGESELERVRFRSGETLDRKALFFLADAHQRSALVERLGCELGRKGTAETSDYEKTNVPGVFVAGDASRRVQFAIVAAAEGAMAAFAINTELLHEERAALSRAR